MEHTEIKTQIRKPWQHAKKDSHLTNSNWLKLLDVLPLAAKNHLIAVMGEFAGTFLFLFFAFGGTNAVNVNAGEGPADPAKLLYISLCFGMSLAVNAWVFFRISGGLFNPAVTLGMMIVGAVDYIRGPMIIVSQMLGGITAAAAISGLTPGPLSVTTSLGGGTSVVRGIFIEMFLTAQLVFAIFMLAAEKHRGTFIAPIGIGLSLFIAELVGVFYTGGSLNPARSFGPAVVIREFHSYHWIYWVGPILGSLLASAFYVFIKALEYETVNPQQDSTQEAPEVSELSELPKTPSNHPDSNHYEDNGGLWDERVETADLARVYKGGPQLEAGQR
ncbi:aquaporin-like protein [Hypoxylon rubiginosum]|uniref:Aquaporin-like protein n=1 Tax=Hypoxylon rubiginosum TaxID=110542 RepID=A0ACB9YJZ6_9PEZI|nr:aquaporin-like protein [Hypoxylon rubiginosum]